MSTGNDSTAGRANGEAPHPIPEEGAAEPGAPDAPGDTPQDRGAPEERIQALEQALASARTDAEEAREQALRARAEADNLRKRTERDLENAHKYALERFVAELLPVKDSMELGLSAGGAEVEQLREGTEMTLRMLANAVEKFGVQEVDPTGERFDPERHQAMSTRAVDGVPSGQVVQVVQKGYLLNERLVRPALVIVAE